MASRKRPKGNDAENKMIRSLDQLAQYDRFNQDIAPILREAIEKGWSPEQMRQHPRIKAMMEARKITIALTSRDQSQSLRAIEDTTDRNEGKPISRSETTHKYSQLPEEELDSLILSEVADLGDEDSKLPN